MNIRGWRMVAGCLPFFVAAGANAQSPRQPRLAGTAADTGPLPSARGPSSLQSHVAIAVAERLILSDNSRDRVRGVERLAGSGQREAVDRLLRALTEGAPVFRDPRARLTAVRGLAPFTSREAVRQYLARELATEPGATPLMALVRGTAAMALAASEDARSIEVLVAAVRQGGSAADAAGRALLAYPPRSLSSFGNGSDGLPAALCELLGRLGDSRAIGLLRGTLARGLLRGGGADGTGTAETLEEDESKKARAAAALALARLGDQEQVPVAEGWAASSDPSVQLRGIEVLLMSGAPSARRTLAPLLLTAATSTAAYRLAHQSPGLELLPALDEAARTGGDGGKLALILLGRLGGPLSVGRLDAFLKDPARAWDAAFALARAPGDHARHVLEAAQGDPKLARLAARAGTVRALSLGDTPRGLHELLQALLVARDPADRAAGSFGLAALQQADARKLVGSRDPAIVRAAARAVLVAGRDAADACKERIATETDPITRTSLAMAIAASADASLPVSTARLAEWAESDQPFAPLATVLLGPREWLLEKRRLGRLLESDDPVLRSHAALALALSPLPDAASRLAAAWRFEEVGAVRRALVVALAQRREPQRMAILELAAKLDPDDQVRESARLGWLGQVPHPLGRLGAGCARSDTALGGCYVAWISLSPSLAGEATAVRERAAWLLDPSGLSLPVVSDADGAVVVPGVSAGAASFRLASSPLWYDALRHDGSETESVR